MTPEWVNMGIDEGVAEQRLADAYVGDLADYPLHPGLLDLTSFYPIRPKGHGRVRARSRTGWSTPTGRCRRTPSAT